MHVMTHSPPVTCRADTAVAGSNWYPLQVAIYFPEQQHPRYGVVRAVIKDTSNENNSSTAEQQVYLDSDDLVSDNVNPAVSSIPNPMADGKWHMVTISTHADKTKGYLLFLDGVEVGDMLQGNDTGMGMPSALTVLHYMLIKLCSA